ncbi:uncharacterized protein B4U79_03046, partial [Dinothrombium tinctorium]
SRTWASLKASEIIYLAMAFISLIASMGLSIERIISLQKGSSDYTFALFLLWTTIMCMFHVLEGVKSEKPCDLLVFVITSVAVLCYVIFNYATKPNDMLKLARMIIGIVFAPILIGYGLRLAWNYYVSKQLIFRTVQSANVDLQKMCELIFVMSSLLKFDVQLGVSTYILYLDKGLTDLSLDEIIIIVCGVLATIAWVILGFLAMRYEKYELVYVFFVTSIIEPILIIYNLTRYSGSKFQALLIAVYTCGVIAIVVRLITIYCMYRVMNNFGHGLGMKGYY